MAKENARYFSGSFILPCYQGSALCTYPAPDASSQQPNTL